mmetsp:Transcript_3141/g.6781  ORF Transcript_3141/g.6781 Transcript_3141/m.6781 type:complete len:723 (+) Transcript_3141:466-2634(+)
MGPFVLAETNFPSFSVSSVPSFLSPSSNRSIDINKASGNSEKRTFVSTPTSTTTTSTVTSTLSLANFGDSEEHNVEVVHSSPTRRSNHHNDYKHQNDSRTTTITSTRSRNNTDNNRSDNSSDNLKNDSERMSLQLDKYGFIVNIDSKGHIFETNGAESISVPSFAESQRTERREKKWKATLQGWDKQNRQGKNNGKQSKGGNGSAKQKDLSSSSVSKNKQSQLLQKKPLPSQAPTFASNKVISRRLRKGIPDSIRGRTWMALGGGIRVPGMYQEIVRITSDAMLENCREMQGLNRRERQKSLIDRATEGNISSDGAYAYSDSSNTGGNGGDQTPERVGTESNSTSNRTSPTSAASEASTLTNTSPNKQKLSSLSLSTTVSPMGLKDVANKESAPSSQSTNEEEEENKDYATTRAFRSIQDIIERDIHRTFPRHNLFYEEERSIPQTDNNPDGTLDGTNSAGSSNGYVTGICDPELAALILNLEVDIRMVTTPSSGNNDTAVGLQQYSIHDRNDHCTIRATTQSGQAALRRVLRAYSYYDPEVGYCQGMNFIAGMFLTLMTEEEAFWLLVSIMSDKPYNMRGLFGEGMLQTHKVLYVAEKLIHHHLSRLARHFEKEHVHVTMYATQWLLTQYTSSFKFDLVFRVWDVFLGEGWKIIYRIMLALLQKYQTQLLKMSFEEILTFFRDLPERVEGSQIIDIALKIPLRRKVIAKYEEDWESEQQRQ